MKTRHPRTFTIADADWQYLHKVGQGNASKGISILVELDRAREARQTRRAALLAAGVEGRRG